MVGLSPNRSQTVQPPRSTTATSPQGRPRTLDLRSGYSSRFEDVLDNGDVRSTKSEERWCFSDLARLASMSHLTTSLGTASIWSSTFHQIGWSRRLVKYQGITLGLGLLVEYQAITSKDTIQRPSPKVQGLILTYNQMAYNQLACSPNVSATPGHPNPP